jgi:Putative MetA-pathway of phenol degradation
MHCLVITLLLLISHSAFADHASPSFETGSSGAIITVPGSTLPKEKFVFSLGVQYLELDNIPDKTLEDLGTLNEEVHSVNSLLNASANFAYGFNDNLTLGFSLPYVERTDVREAHNDGGVGEAELAGDSNGLGDLNLFGQYRFFNSDSMDIAIIVGLKTPTGDTGEKEIEGRLFEAEQQPGSGSWDPFAGISFNKSLGRIGISSNILYTFVTEGSQDTELGDIFNYNFAASYRAYLPKEEHNHDHHEHGTNLLDYIDVVLELNGDYRKKTDISGEKEAHSGGNTLYVSPGVRVGIGHTWSLFTSVGIPIIDDLNGVQSESDYRIFGGISKSF